MNLLRALASRPIGERERRGAFWIGAAVLIAAAVLLNLIPNGAPPSTSSPVPGRVALRPASEPARVVSVSGPEAAARRFLVGFLSFLYGQGSPDAISAVAPALADRLNGSRRRVSPAALARHPTITQLEGRRLGSGRASVLARIEDGGVASYPIALTLARRGGRWLVVAEGMD